MRLLFGLLQVLAFSVSARSETIGQWSAIENGLQARVTIEQKSRVGLRVLVPYFELRNSENGPSQTVDCSMNNFRVEVLDERGQPAKVVGPMVISGPDWEIGRVVIPVDSSIRLALDQRNQGFPSAKTVIPAAGAVIADGQRGKVFLRVTLSVPKTKERTWSGVLQAPLVKVDW